MTKIGITERGDAALDLSWVSKLDSVDGAIIITKNICRSLFRQAVLENQEKLILHATITTMGHTNLEPNVPYFGDSLEALKSLIEEGFDPKRVVFRLDPIIYKSQVSFIQAYLSRIIELGIERLRFSFADFYPHVKERFKEKGYVLPELNKSGFTLDPTVITNCLKILNSFEGISVESCGEYINNRFSNIEKIGCISEKDLQILGLSYKEIEIRGIRKYCQCLSCKTELLDNRKQCAHGCIYCYWK